MSAAAEPAAAAVPTTQVGLQLLGRGAALLLNVFTFGVLLNSLGAAGFGDMTIGLTVAYIGSVILGFGMDTALFRHLSLHPADGGYLADTIAAKALSSLAASAILIGAAFALPLGDSLRWCVVAAGLSLLAAPLTAVTQVLRSRVILTPLAWSDITSSVLLLVSVVALDRLDVLNAALAVAATLGANIVVWLGLAVVATRQLRPRRPSGLTGIRRVVRGARGIGLGEVTVVGYYRADVLVLGALSTAVATGVYGAAYRLVDIAMYVQSIVIGAAFPSIARGWGSPERLRPAVEGILRQIVPLAGAIACVIAAVGPGLITLVGGDDFGDTRGTLTILMFALIVMFANRLTTQSLIAGGHQRDQLLAWSGGVVGVLVCVVLAPAFGAVGAAWAVLIGEVLILVISAALLARRGVLTIGVLVRALAVSFTALGVIAIFCGAVTDDLAPAAAVSLVAAAILLWQAGLYRRLATLVVGRRLAAGRSLA